MAKNNVLDRAVGVGGKGTKNLGAYTGANGETTTYRPEFAGQTVQMGNQYVTYNERGYPTKATSVSHAQSLGNAYTKQNMGLDQTKISNAADIYRGIYNATMQGGTAANGYLGNAYGKQNIQYSNGYSAEDYAKLIADASAKGSNVLAGYLEDSRNALLHSTGRDSEQTSTYNGGWNYVDNGGGVGNIYAKALKDLRDADQALGGGWYAGQGKGNASEEYFYRNTDAPTMQEVLSYAAALGYDVNDDSTALPLGNLAREMMANGYVSPENLRKAETLKTTVPAALKNLGIESDSSGTEALDAAIRNMQTAGSGAYAKIMQAANAQASGGNGYQNLYSQYLGGYGSSPQNQLMALYGNGGSYAAALQQMKSLTDAKTAQTTGEYNAKKDAVNHSYADMFRQLYIDRENARKNIDQQMAAQGVTGGAAESTLLGLNTRYQDALREGEQSRIGAISELDQAILQAQLTGDISFAEQALQMEQERLDHYANVLKSMLSREDSLREQKYDRQMEKAELLASIGDFSGYRALGLTDEEIAALENAYWTKL